MKNIYLVVGPSGVGKTTAVEELQRRYGYVVVESYTDRPARYEGETGHIFLTEDEFKKLPPLCAYTCFNGYHYGVTSEIVDRRDLYVIDLAGVDFFKQHYTGNKKPVVIGLVQEPEVLRARMLKRGDSPDMVNERLAHDAKAFRDMNKYCDMMISSSELEAVVNCMHEYIDYREKHAEDVAYG